VVLKQQSLLSIFLWLLIFNHVIEGLDSAGHLAYVVVDARQTAAKTVRAGLSCFKSEYVVINRPKTDT